MTTHVGLTVTNAFPVTDPAAFVEVLDQFRSVSYYTEPSRPDWFRIVADDGLPDGRYVETDDGHEEWEGFDFLEDVLVKHIAPGALGTVTGIGNEGARFVTGHAIAFTSEKVVASLYLDDIESVARAAMKSEATAPSIVEQVAALFPYLSAEAVAVVAGRVPAQGKVDDDLLDETFDEVVRSGITALLINRSPEDIWEGDWEEVTDIAQQLTAAETNAVITGTALPDTLDRFSLEW